MASWVISQREINHMPSCTVKPFLRPLPWQTWYSWQKFLHFNLIECVTKDHLSWETIFLCPMGGGGLSRHSPVIVRYQFSCFTQHWNTVLATWLKLFVLIYILIFWIYSILRWIYANLMGAQYLYLKNLTTLQHVQSHFHWNIKVSKTSTDMTTLL